MFAVLNQNYPAPRADLRSGLITFLFGAFIGLFLVFFEPFDLNLYAEERKIFISLFYGLIATLVLFFFLYLLPLLIPHLFLEKNWKVKHQLAYYLLLLLVIATLNGLYTNYINDLNFSWVKYGWMIKRTFVLGGLPIAFITLLDHQRKSIFYSSLVRSVYPEKKPLNEVGLAKVWTIATGLKDEVFQLEEAKFIYAAAVGNYVDIYSLRGKEVKKTTYRLSLSALEKQVQSCALKRCHRSFLVNLKKIETISGNAQGLKVKLSQVKTKLPVSRKYIASIKAALILA